MLFKVEMTIAIPDSLPAERVTEIKAQEKAYAQQLQRSGKWRHVWRVAGQFKNVSIFDVESHDELHELLTGLPLYPYMTMAIEPLCRHPSSIRDDDS
ncbi:muconolactone D-isomerase [Erwinia persicina]|uniref:Muconolactone Delta-isomerase n=1 Tax=Erwinia plantamica TaxID=3237104 RepID=A0ABW7CR51_9GAMM|nr:MULTISPECIES: muconolactone Delta-isomerase [Erwinia]MCP1437069.1 muconolactone D-isomerase [Erwinia persicina]MDN8540433.1 muconolactone Delta-isomerase [Erwinia sp. BC051422]